MGTIVYNEEHLVDLPLEVAWEMATDTNHFNHYAKLFHVHYSPLFISEGDVIREAKANVFGIVPTKWREYTFSWVRNKWFEIERIYFKSPMKRALWKISLEPYSPTQTLMRVHGDFTYANFAGKIALERIVIPQLRSIFHYANEFARTYQANEIRPQAKQSVTFQSSLLEKRKADLLAIYPYPDHVTPLVTSLQSANDEDVTGMRPYRWARQQGITREAALELFLLATKVGLLEQRWSMMCPNCRVPKKQVTSLRAISSSVHCELCGIDYAVDFDRSLEMQFDVAPAIRKSAGMLYCVNGPMNSKHILGQFRIPAGEEVTLHLPNWSQPYRYRILQLNDVVEVTASGESGEHLTYSADGFSTTHVRPTASIDVHNTCSHEIVFMIEELALDPDVLTARELTGSQLFRDLFATEVLSPEQEIHVGHLTILFTDLKESTAMYERIGDAVAYANVREHFTYLKHHIQSNRGTIVKTIGDAVMAVFPNEQDAFQAACAIQSAIHTLDSDEQSIVVKMGLHKGPVIAVNANDVLDYFGRTVNTAARIQQLSAGDDLVLTKELFEQLEGTEGYRTEEFQASLKGIHTEVTVKRLNFETISREIPTQFDTA